MEPTFTSLAGEEADPIARRSCLSVPANSERKLRKAATAGADEIVIDLEDSVPPAAKAEALAAVLDVLAHWGETGPSVAVRVNPPGSPWSHLELTALAGANGPVRSVVVPKVESAGDLAFVDRLLAGAELAAHAPRMLQLQALIETASGLARLDEIASASPRLESLILGYADLAASLGRPSGTAAELDVWQPAQHAVLVAARTHGLQAIDGPFLGVTDDEPFRAAAVRARDLGYDGKWAIHPSQVAALNELFTPSEEEIRHAHEVLAALAAGEDERGTGAVRLDDRMLDEAVRKSALRVLNRAGEGPA